MVFAKNGRDKNFFLAVSKEGFVFGYCVSYWRGFCVWLLCVFFFVCWAQKRSVLLVIHFFVAKHIYLYPYDLS